ncbi:hypothetical protein PQR05_29390 [Paraburkholderia sediminicola]|uniref:hypothetical protein n=1 Tax=Paraburkholderia sediminicola TaxID=458836 RepID=UPI0038B8D973
MTTKSKIPPLSIVKRHRTMLAATDAAKSTTTVTLRTSAPEPKFCTVLAPNANWPT